MKAILNANFQFIAKGTVLKKDVAGDYFVSRTDDEVLNSPVKSSTITIKGQFVESNPDIFEIVEKDETRESLLNDAVQMLSGLAATDSIVEEAINKIRRAQR